MENTQIKIIEKIQNSYVQREPSKIERLQQLNSRVERPAKIFSYTFGSISALVLGTGMSLAMKVIGAGLSLAMPLGIGIGLVGLIGVSVNYSLYKNILKGRKKKYAKQVLSLTDELLNK